MTDEYAHTVDSAVADDDDAPRTGEPTLLEQLETLQDEVLRGIDDIEQRLDGLLDEYARSRTGTASDEEAPPQPAQPELVPAPAPLPSRSPGRRAA